jgi:hypothetical protein
MDQVKFIIDQIKTTFMGNSFLDTSITRTIEDLLPKEALLKSHPQERNIWELIKHISIWNQYATNILQQCKVLKLDEEEEWAPSGKTEADWITTKNELKRSVNLLINELMKWNNQRLLEIIPGSETSYKQMLHGVLHHNLYHLGQIALLKSQIKKLIN